MEAELALCFCKDDFKLKSFYFSSETISIGSLSYSGLSAGLESFATSPFSFTQDEGMVLDRLGNPETNMGVFFRFPESRSGMACYRRDTYSSVNLWFVPDFLMAGQLVLNQSFSFNEEKGIEDSWYLQEAPLYSSFIGHSLASLVLGDGSLYGGSRLIVNTSPSDRGGVSLLLLVGGSGEEFEGQADLLWITPYFVSAGFEKSMDSIIISAQGVWKEFPIDLESHLNFRLGRETLPWENREMEFNHKLRAKKEWLFRFLDTELSWGLLLDRSDDLLPEVSLQMEYGRDFKKISWSGILLGEYKEEIFHYRLTTKGSIESNPFESSLTLSLDIDESVYLKGAARFSRVEDKWNLSVEAGFENLGIYNKDSTDWEPYFSVELSFFKSLHADKSGHTELSDL